MTLVGVATALAVATPAHADPLTDNNFLGALTNAGIGFNDPGNTEQLGQSICPMLAQPGGSFAAAASGISHRGMSPQMAQMFTTIAIQTYCPTEIANIAGGNPSGGLPQLPGVGGIPGI